MYIFQNNWKKFGELSNVPRGALEVGVTYLGDEVKFDPTEANKVIHRLFIQYLYIAYIDSFQKEEETKETEDTPKPHSTGFTCRHCGGTHWSHKCTKYVPVKEDKPAAPTGYVPPQRRGRGGDHSEPEREITTLRVSNLSEDCTDDDLRGVFSRYGLITRIFLARDRETQLPKGFAYVTFASREEADRAKTGASGVGVDHLIWSIEWAKS